MCICASCTCTYAYACPVPFVLPPISISAFGIPDLPGVGVQPHPIGTLKPPLMHMHVPGWLPACAHVGGAVDAVAGAASTAGGAPRPRSVRFLQIANPAPPVLGLPGTWPLWLCRIDWAGAWCWLLGRMLLGWLKLGRRLAGGLPHPARAGWPLWRRPGPLTRLRCRLRRRLDGAVLLRLRLWLLLSSCSWGRALWAGLRFAGRPFLPTAFLLDVHRRRAIFAHACFGLLLTVRRRRRRG